MLINLLKRIIGLKRKTEQQLNHFPLSRIYEDYEEISIQYRRKIITAEVIEHSQRFHEFAIRLDHRYLHLKDMENILSRVSRISVGMPVSEIQLEFVNAVESYFQQLYASISSLILLINKIAPHDFKRGMSIRSTKQFLDFIEKKEGLNLGGETIKW